MYFLFSLSFLGVSVVSLLGALYTLSFHSISLEFSPPWVGLSSLHLSFLFDYISLTYFSVVAIITSVVFLYSGFYMSVPDTPSSDNERFLYLLMLFVVSMFLLVFSSSWVTVMLGWDGLGLVSFLLVIYFNNSSTLNSGLITVFSNRIGDCLFILSFTFIFYCGWGSIEFLQGGCCLFFTFVLVLGAITKSAQLPFSSWLPAAMAAPTPVSSLVHSSTLVTAGVYLLVRFNSLVESSFNMLMVISLCTMLIAGLCANLELDFKKIVAMSTLSQLGFMLFSVSLGMWELCYLHMVFHAFFKSMLFLSTGSLMHAVGSNQDSRSFGSFSNSFFSRVFFSSSCLSLMGFPFSIGFYSKDYILSAVNFSSFSVVSLVFFFSCGFTVSYSMRLIHSGFMGFPSFYPSFSFKEEKLFFLPVLLLYFSCVFLGNFFSYNYLSPVVFSFFDMGLGLLVLSLGGLLFMFLSYNYHMSFYLSTLGFLSIVSSSGMSSTVKFFPWKDETTWGELLGGKGLSELYSLNNSLFLRSNTYSLPMLSVLVLIVSLVFIY